MTEPPASNLFTRYVLENPWPLGIVLVAFAIALGWSGLREGLKSRVRPAIALGVIGVLAIVAGTLTTTSGEHAKHATRALVNAVVNKDVLGGLALFSDDAVMNSGSPQNAGVGLDMVEERFADLARTYTIESNSIARLRGYSISGDEAEVHLECSTTVASFPTASQWILRWRKNAAGEWKVTRLTCISINGQTMDIRRLW